jgi:hypothetical protein
MHTTGNARPHHKTQRNPHIPLTLLNPCAGSLGHPFGKEAHERRMDAPLECPHLTGQGSEGGFPHARTTLFSRDGEASFMAGVFISLQQLKDGCLHALSSRFARWTKPLRTSFPFATLTDLGKSKSQLLVENALLRHQLIMLNRQVKRPPVTRTDRILLVLLARLVRTWQQTLVIMQPETLLRWHRELFRLYWKRKSKTHPHKPKVAPETIALIREMAKENRLWGAELICEAYRGSESLCYPFFANCHGAPHFFAKYGSPAGSLMQNVIYSRTEDILPARQVPETIRANDHPSRPISPRH